MTIEIKNTSYDDFFTATKCAFEKANIAPIRRDNIIRRFLKHQLFPQGNPGENEHRLPTLFENDSLKETSHKEGTIYIVRVGHYMLDGGSLVLEDIDTYVCASIERAHKEMYSIFERHYPDGQNGERLLGSTVVTNAIEKMARDDAEVRKIEEGVAEMDSNEACQWLRDNICIDELFSDSFFSDHLHMNTLEMSIVAEKLFK
jgi:hypothetical protein